MLSDIYSILLSHPGGYYDSYVGDEPRGTGTHIVDDHLHGANGHDNIQYEATETQKLGNPQGYQAQRQPDGYTQSMST